MAPRLSPVQAVILCLCAVSAQRREGFPLSSRTPCRSSLAQWACPLADEPVAALQALLDRGLVGQTLAALAVRKAIAQNADTFSKERVRKRDKIAGYLLGFPYTVTRDLGYVFGIPSNATRKHGRGETLFLHFSGPTGVGKSLTASFVAQALFSRDSSDASACGALTLNLNQYRGLKGWQIPDVETDLRQMIHEQLAQCPRSVFVIDEIQSVPPSLVNNLVSVFQLSPQRAFPVVVLISDLGSEKLDATMTRAQAVDAIAAASSRRFGRQFLTHNLVPFLPLSREDLEGVASLQLQMLQAQLRLEFGASWRGKLTWHPLVTTLLAASCQDDAHCFQEGGRGIESVVQHLLQSDVEVRVAQCLEQAASASSADHSWAVPLEAGAELDVCSDNIDIRLADPVSAAGIRSRVEGLQLVLDSVYDRDEFEGWQETDTNRERRSEF